MKKVLKHLLILCVFWIFLVGYINYYIVLEAREHIYSEIENTPEKSVGLVLGASVLSSGIPSGILQDRLDSAYELYEIGKIENILVSGDNSREEYNESDAMGDYLVNKWVPEDDVYRDYAGFDTYDSMYRAEYIFGVTNMMIFTQEYHLSRSVYIARKLWIEAVWFISDKHIYAGIKKYKTREVLSRIKAFFDVKILKSQPKFLGESIEIQ